MGLFPSPRASEKLTDQAGLAQLLWTHGIWAFATWFYPREGHSPMPISAHHLPPLLGGTRALSSAGGSPPPFTGLLFIYFPHVLYLYPTPLSIP